MSIRKTTKKVDRAIISAVHLQSGSMQHTQNTVQDSVHTNLKTQRMNENQRNYTRLELMNK